MPADFESNYAVVRITSEWMLTFQCVYVHRNSEKKLENHNLYFCRLF